MGRRDRGIGLENAPWLYGKFLIPFFFWDFGAGTTPNLVGFSSPQLRSCSPFPLSPALFAKNETLKGNNQNIPALGGVGKDPMSCQKLGKSGR